MGSSQALLQLEQDIIYEATGTNMVYPKLNSGKCITGRACIHVFNCLLTLFYLWLRPLSPKGLSLIWVEYKCRDIAHLLTLPDFYITDTDSLNISCEVIPQLKALCRIYLKSLDGKISKLDMDFYRAMMPQYEVRVLSEPALLKI